MPSPMPRGIVADVTHRVALSMTDGSASNVFCTFAAAKSIAIPQTLVVTSLNLCIERLSKFRLGTGRSNREHANLKSSKESDVV